MFNALIPIILDPFCITLIGVVCGVFIAKKIKNGSSDFLSITFLASFTIKSGKYFPSKKSLHRFGKGHVGLVHLHSYYPLPNSRNENNYLYNQPNDQSCNQTLVDLDAFLVDNPNAIFQFR